VTATVRQLALLVSGHVLGDGDVVIQAARTLQEAQSGDLTFVESAKYVPMLHQSKASAAVVSADVALPGKTLIQVADPLMAFVVIAQHLQGKGVRQATGIDRRAIVHPSATVGPEASIDPFASIGENTNVGKRTCIHANVVIGKNCRLGDDVVLHPNVVLYDDTILGDRVIIHANSVIGADGFGYRFQHGKNVKVPQLGNVVVGNDVEIGACSTIDRGTFQATLIGEGTKIDNLVQVAHNCKIGKHNIFAAQVGIAGSCVTGNNVFLGGQAGISDHIRVGDGAAFGAKTGVFHDVAAGKRMFLYPEFEERDAGRIIACLRKLPGMRKDLLRVLKELNLAEGATAPAAEAQLAKPAA
jgi:UDP-3-O-[3-hydroxymyristoyl] glucosamine N-acyltransferase